MTDIDIERLRRMAEEIKGCSSHACMVAKPEGMGTNATKCYCPEWKIRRVIFALTARLEKIEAQRNRLADVLILVIEWQGIDCDSPECPGDDTCTCDLPAVVNAALAYLNEENKTDD